MDQGSPVGVLGESARQAGLWECLGVEHTAVQPEATPFDPGVTDAIREFDPYFLPIWSRKMYRAPTGEVLILGYHTLARWINHPPGSMEMEPVKLAAIPADWPFDASGCVYEVRTWAVPWPKGTPQRRAAWPDVYLPCDWDIYYYCRDVFFTLKNSKLSPEFFEKMAMAERIRDTQRLMKLIEDHRQRVRDDRRMFQRAFDEGRIYDAPKDPKPFVQVPRRAFTGA